MYSANGGGKGGGDVRYPISPLTTVDDQTSGARTETSDFLGYVLT